MKLQIIKDGSGKNAGVFIPMSDWDEITQKYKDLQQLISSENTSQEQLSKLAGSLSHETAEAMLKYVEESRKEWDDRLKKQF